jgi:outer membrane immunogenic protein
MRKAAGDEYQFAVEMEDRMKKLLLAGAGVIALLGGSASAADLARPVPVYAPRPVVALFTWTGCYVGGNVGGIWAKSDWNDNIAGDFGTNTASGALGGVQGGCNYQVGGWVFGIQGDYDWSNASNSSANVIFPLFTDQSQIRSLASVTGRVGYAWDRFLGYVKAGGAWEQSDYNLLVGGANLVTASTSQSGWTIGVGGEYAFLNWLTGFVEYDYYQFNNGSSNALVCTPALCGAAVAFSNVSVNTNVNVLKAGVNFKFGPGFGY